MQQPSTWRKSRHSHRAADPLCVEVGVLGKDRRAIRGSRDPDGPWLLLTCRQLRELFDAIKAR